MAEVLLLVRHAQSAFSRTGRLAGHSDPPLSPAGRVEVAEWVRTEAFRQACATVSLVASSDLRRATETARSIATALDRPMETHAALRERSFGAFDGQLVQEAKAEHPCWQSVEQCCTARPPGGEPLGEVFRRVTGCLLGIANRAADATAALVVGHSMAWRLMAAAASGGPVFPLTEPIRPTLTTWRIGVGALLALAGRVGDPYRCPLAPDQDTTTPCPNLTRADHERSAP